MNKRNAISFAIFVLCAVFVFVVNIILLASDDWLTAEEDTYEEGLFTVTFPSIRNRRDADGNSNSTEKCQNNKGPAEIVAITFTIASLTCIFVGGVIKGLVISDLVRSPILPKLATFLAFLAGLCNFMGNGIYHGLKKQDMRTDECAGKTPAAEFDWALYLGYASGAVGLCTPMITTIEKKEKPNGSRGIPMT